VVGFVNRLLDGVNNCALSFRTKLLGTLESNECHLEVMRGLLQRGLVLRFVRLKGK
jgi:hypothetical protein